MSDEKNELEPESKPTPPKKPGIFSAKKNTVSDFARNKNKFLSPKPGNSKMKGGGFKGGGVKKGK